MKRKLPETLLFSGLVTAALSALGQLPAPPPSLPPVPEAPVAAASSAPVQQHAIPEGLTPAARDPFWPVGYVPKSAEELEREKHQGDSGPNIPAPKWSEAKAALRIGGYMKSPIGYTALVNNALVKIGDTIVLTFDGKQYRWNVESISAGGITLTPLDWTQIEKTPLKPKDRL